jgi:hypothetical protein
MAFTRILRRVAHWTARISHPALAIRAGVVEAGIG